MSDRLRLVPTLTPNLKQSRAAALVCRFESLKEEIQEMALVMEAAEESKNKEVEFSNNLHESVRRFEIALIRRALEVADGRQRKAAELLGVKITTLNSKIKRYKI